MVLPVPVDLKSLSFDRTYELLAPLLPGGVLVFGVVLGRPDLLAQAEAALGLGHYAGWVLLLIGAYISGFVLYHVSGFPLVIPAATAVALMTLARSKADPRQNLAASKRLSWRRPAIKLFGADLFPEASQDGGSGQPTDEQWHDWYNALQDYMWREYEIPRDARATIDILNGMGWAIIAVRIATPVFHHWLFLAAAILSIALYPLVFVGIHMNYSSTTLPTYWGFTARLLRELREKEKRDLAK
jgi:hypothetical protein